MTIKTETATVADFDLRFASEDEGVFEGHAALFDQRNSHNEIIKRGAFAKTLRMNRNIPMLWSHDRSLPIGVWEDLREDATGLAVRGRLIRETSKGAEAYALMRAGAVNGLSIGFRPVGQERSQGNKILTEIALVEVSLVTLPSAGEARIHSIRTDSSHATSAVAFINAVNQATRSLKGK